MYDARQYFDRYDLYRPTTETSVTQERTRAYPDTATVSSAPCLFTDVRAEMKTGEPGITIRHDAEIRVPAGTDLRAAHRGQEPDKVVLVKVADEVVSRPFVVKSVASHYGKYVKAVLSETPA